jgi:hypothetical protein
MDTRLLLFDHFLADQKALIYGPDGIGEPDEHVISSALQEQSLILLDQLRGHLERCPSLSGLMTSPRARDFICYGTGRRLSMIWRAYRSIVINAPPDRVRPLTSDESGDLTEDINIIYLNIRGVMDNLCWALLHEYAPDLTILRPSKVGLFLPSLTKDQRFAGLVECLQHHDGWDRDVKSRRDPAAHQIPLYIPPQTLTPHEAAEYQKTYGDYWTSVASHNFNEADEIMRHLDRIGRFTPYFAHNPDEGAMPIYPTVSNDIAHLVAIFSTIDKFFVNLIDIKK